MDKIKVKFLGEASEQVTGSMILVTLSNGKNILIECGMAQTNNLFTDYKINSADFPFKVKDIDLVIACHLHSDHIACIPKLYNRGYRGNVLMPKDSKKLMNLMLLDSQYIMSKTQTYIQSQGKKTKLCYDVKDVENCVKHTKEIPFSERYYLDDDTYIVFLPSQHIAASAQLVLWHKGKTLGYTSDLGNLTNPSFYTNKFEPIRHVDVLIGESTYGLRTRNTANRSDDLARMKAIVDETKGTVLASCFALGRTEEAVTHFYDIGIKTPLYADSPLSAKILYEYRKLFDMEEIFDWQNFKIIEHWKDSQRVMCDPSKKVVCASQGMCNAGRSMEYTKQLVSNPFNTILLMGYCASGTIGRQLQDGAKKVKIMGVEYDVNCRVETLHSFSSHMQRPDLLDYYSTVNTPRIILTHGDKQAKLELKEDLEKELYKKCKSTKVLISEKGMEVNI